MAKDAQTHFKIASGYTKQLCVCLQLQEKFYFDTYVVLSGLIFINFFSLPVSF